MAETENEKAKKDTGADKKAGTGNKAVEEERKRAVEEGNKNKREVNNITKVARRIKEALKNARRKKQ